MIDSVEELKRRIMEVLDECGFRPLPEVGEQLSLGRVIEVCDDGRIVVETSVTCPDCV